MQQLLIEEQRQEIKRQTSTGPAGAGSLTSLESATTLSSIDPLPPNEWSSDNASSKHSVYDVLTQPGENPFNNPKPLLGRTLRDSAGYLAEKFRSNQRKIPFHEHDRQNILNDTVSQLFRAWSHSDPPVKRNSAITPRHLRFMYEFALQQKQ
jgi:hypothetical protein